MRFKNPNEESDARTRLSELRQGKESVLTFHSTLVRLAATPGLEDISEKSLLHTMRRGLNSGIQRLLIGRNFESLEALLAAAVDAEQQLRGEMFMRARLHALQLGDSATDEYNYSDSEADVNALRVPGRSGGHGARPNQGVSRGGGYPSADNRQFKGRQQAGERRCFNCGEVGHLAKECKGALTCFRCGGKGHRSDNCTAKR